LEKERLQASVIQWTSIVHGLQQGLTSAKLMDQNGPGAEKIIIQNGGKSMTLVLD
ncbi:hypothetical protein CPC16_004527, partial [Podila verticillata]